MALQITLDKDLYLFELDDVLFARQDYILQVYYLFASFFEFTEGTVKANDMAQFMKKVYEHHGEDQVFVAIREIYGVDEKYHENFDRLQANAQLPLKLEIQQGVVETLKVLFEAKKQVAVLTKGNPVEQLNKLKFIEWGDLQQFKNDIKIYFIDELEFKSFDPIDYIANENNLAKEKILFLNSL